jgi:hypothetical protein
MSPLHRRRTAESSVFALLFSTFLLSTARADEPGFKSLFNGKDLTGWRLRNTELAGKAASDDGRFAVKDGILVISGSKDTPPRMAEIDTVESYDGDFTLHLEFRAFRNANSGLHLRDKAFAHQLQIRDYPQVGPYKALKGYKDGDWNAIEVVVTITVGPSGSIVNKPKVGAGEPTSRHGSNIFLDKARPMCCHYCSD